MASLVIRIGTRDVPFRKATVAPDFRSRTVLASDPWDYVEMWLKRRKFRDALFYWEQAHHFFSASVQLPNTASPLTTYYFMLNAVKALLTVRKVQFGGRHGVSGETRGRKTSLANEYVKYCSHGVLSALCGYLGESANDEEYTLKDIFYNLPYIHRAYNLTFSSQPELFFPIANPCYVRKTGSREAWFCAELADRRLQSEHTLGKLPSGFERDEGVKERWVVRRKNRFAWQPKNESLDKNLQRLIKYHCSTRGSVHYIHGPSRLWYFKRDAGVDGIIQRSPLSLAFAAMHRLSEMARYDPLQLARHFDCQHNWLLSEFLSTSLYQMCDEIASEITGQDFMLPGRKAVS